ncbi:MAG: bestrophin family ion channel [Chitinophagaceae bacterium]
MISYNTKDWITFIFKIHKSDTFRKLWPLIVFICGYSGLIAYLEISYWKLSDNHHLQNITLMHGILSFVISMLLVFRTNTAYERWWEGRKLWGTLVNNSRSLAVKLTAMLPAGADKEREFFCTVIPQYAIALKNHLMKESTRLALDEAEHPEFNGIAYEKHVPNQVHFIIFKKINELYEQQKISGDQYRILNNEIQGYADVCGACERIKNTPIPYSYSAFIKKFIFFYVMTLPWGYAFSLGYFVIPVVAFIFYVLASLELIAEEIEDPFGADTNDLPMQKICENIEKHIQEIMN